MARLTRLMTVAVVGSLFAAGCGSSGTATPEAGIDELISGEGPGTGTGVIGDDPSGGAADGGTSVGPSGAAGDGTGAGVAPGGDPDGSAAGSQPGSGASGAGTGTTGGGSGTGTGPSGGGTTTTPVADDDLVMGRGVTADTITIGFQAGETGAAFAAVGAALAPAYENEMAAALVDWLNATGGIRGRQVEGVYHETETTQGTFASQAQAVCSTMAEDNETFVVISSAVGGDDSLASCLHDKQTPLVELNTWIWDEPQLRGFPNLYRPGHFRAEEGYRAYLEGLAALGFFEGATVGLLRFDAPVFDRIMEGVVEPTTQRLGVEYVEQVISSPGGVSDFGGAGAEMANAVVRFRAAGVTHVVMIENAGIMPFFFLKEAESQGFRPRYGFSTIDIPQTQASQGDPNQLRGALAIGWAPPIDVNGDDVPSPNAAFQLCDQILEDAGVENRAGFYAQSRCDAVFMLRAALERAPALTADGLRAGVESLGTSHQSPFTWRAEYGPDKHWAAASVAPLAYLDECECFRYTGGPYRVS